MAEVDINSIDPSEWTLVNKETGEMIDGSVLGRPSNGFSKLFDGELFVVAKALGGNPAVTLLAWMLANKDKNNCVICRKAEIADEISSSPTTVVRLIKQFSSCGLIRSYSRGMYMINPNVTYSGSFAKQAFLKDTWRSLLRSN